MVKEETNGRVAAYIAQQEVKQQDRLTQLHQLISQLLPQAQEKIAYGMPTFYERKNIIHFAAHRHHLGIYPGPAAIKHFQADLAAYKSSKGAIQFPWSQDLPLDLLEKITLWANEHNQ